MNQDRELFSGSQDNASLGHHQSDTESNAELTAF